MAGSTGPVQGQSSELSLDFLQGSWPALSRRPREGPAPPTRQGPEDPHSPWEAPTGARLSEDPELSLWELSWLTLRPGRWAWGDEAGASGGGGLSCELPSRKRELWVCRAWAAGERHSQGEVMCPRAAQTVPAPRGVGGQALGGANLPPPGGPDGPPAPPGPAGFHLL